MFIAKWSCITSVPLQIWKKPIITFFREKERHLADVFVRENLLPFFMSILFRVLRVLIKPERSTSLGK